MLKKKLFAFALLALIIFLPVLSFAADVNGDLTPCGSSGKICNPINAETINEFIQKILVGAIKIGIPTIALAIIYSGFLFVSARGNSEKLTTAKKALTYSLIGAAILLGAWAIAKLIAETILAL